MSEKGDAGDVERGVLELGLKEEQNRNESTPADLVSLPAAEPSPPNDTPPPARRPRATGPRTRRYTALCTIDARRRRHHATQDDPIRRVRPLEVVTRRRCQTTSPPIHLFCQLRLRIRRGVSLSIVGVVKPSLLSGGCGSVRRALARSIRKVFLPITSSQACQSRSAEVRVRRVLADRLSNFKVLNVDNTSYLAPLVDGLMMS